MLLNEAITYLNKKLSLKQLQNLNKSKIIVEMKKSNQNC